MRVWIRPGGIHGGDVIVPGDRSIACRWLILAVTAKGRSTLAGVPRSLDVLAMISALAALAPLSRPVLEAAAANPRVSGEPSGFTWDASRQGKPERALSLEGEGWEGLAGPGRDLDCRNSGTTMRLLSGVVASRPFRT